MHAYDIEVLKRPVDRADPDDRGWCFGLPPGIAPEHWPLDPHNGYPMVHGFTLLLPEDYRCHGEEIVALSFFATPHDMNDGAPIAAAEIEDAFAEAAEPAACDLKVFWRSERQRHPRLHRMEDILGCAFAVILLTRGEYEGVACPPPPVAPNRYRDALQRPAWLDAGSASAFRHAGDTALLHRVFGCEPPPGHDFNLAVRYAARAHDPNAGLAPRERWAVAKSEYQPPFYFLDGVSDANHYREHEWTRGHAPIHIGGTMRPVQSIPADFSPFYIEFEEWVGGYNFGGGNAQLDFQRMAFDWACG